MVQKATGEAADPGRSPGKKVWAGDSQCVEGCRPSTKHWIGNSQCVEGCRAAEIAADHASSEDLPMQYPHMPPCNGL